MSDPLAQTVSLLRPAASFSKVVIGRGSWLVRRDEAGRPFYCVILDGACRLAAGGQAAVTLVKGDFVLIPSAYDFAVSSVAPEPPAVPTQPVTLRHGVYQVGSRGCVRNLRMVVGSVSFEPANAELLLRLLPRLIHIRGQRRLTALVRLVDEEARAERPARDVVLSRLVEVLLLEALRSAPRPGMASGLVRGLGEEPLAIALRLMHAYPTRAWTVAQLAKQAALSRSGFFDRFHRTLGVTPMEYLLRWRMALAKDLLTKNVAVAAVAERVGYSSASTFSVAFSRHAGQPPAAYARRQRRRAGEETLELGPPVLRPLHSD